MDGSLNWKKDLGYLDAGAFDHPEIQWGFGNSPVIYDGRLFVLCDVNNQSFIASYDVKSGKELWRTERDENPTWCTPTIHKSKDRTLVIVNGYKHIGAYDADTGKAVWWMKGGGDVPVPTPIVAHDLIFITNAHGRMRPIYAVKLDAVGDITLKEGETSNRFIPWSYSRNGAYQPTPIVIGDYLYVADNRGVLGCYQATTGKMMYRKPLGGKLSSFSASAVAADGILYFTDEYGTIHVMEAGPEYKHLASNKMDEVCMASPAIARNTLLIRARRYLYAIGN